MARAFSIVPSFQISRDAGDTEHVVTNCSPESATIAGTTIDAAPAVGISTSWRPVTAGQAAQAAWMPM